MSAEWSSQTDRSPHAGAPVLLLLIGILTGVSGAVLGRVAPWPIMLLPHYAAPYVLLLTLIGASADTRRVAAARAVACFLAFVAAYYSIVAVEFGSIPVLYASAWLLAALTVCPLAAAAVRLATTQSALIQAAAAAVAGAVALSDGTVGNLVYVVAGWRDPMVAQPVLAAVDRLVAGAAIIVITKGVRARWLAITLLVPCATAATYIGGAVHFGPGHFFY